MKPDAIAIKRHLEFLFSGLSDFDDGKIEISILNQAEHFSVHELDKATECAVKWNEQGHSVYVCGALIDPDAPPFGRSSDDDFYASGVVWADIDAPHDPDALKQLYASMPPNVAVITSRTPHRRLQIWWKLQEPLTDADTLREALQGVAQHLGGDVNVINPVRLMRLAGTINYPTEKKRASGRIAEITEYHSISAKNHDIDAILCTYKSDGFMHAQPRQETAVSVAVNPFTEQIVDGRDKYMSDMLYASIINLTAEFRRWPTAQEVYDDAWPVYSRKVAGRNGRTLEQDGRGQKLMVSKIKSKLSAFQRGKIKGMETPDAFPKNAAKITKIQPVQQPKEEIDPDTGEIIEAPKNAENLLPYTWAYDISPQIEANDFVEGLLGTGQFSVIYGESNCGKTFYMTDLAFHVAMGRRWRNRRVDQGGVVYVALEGGFGLKNRIAAFMQENAADAAGMPFAVITTQIDFLDPEGKIGAFIETVKDVSEKVGNVKLIVIDTLARAISGGDENSSQDMGKLVSHADIIRATTGAHVCFVHHSGKDRARGARGHSSLRAAVDTEIEVSRDDGADFSTVKIVKQRDMEIGENMYFALKTVSLGVNRHNEEVKSCVVVEHDAPEIVSKNEASLTPSQQFVYDQILNLMNASGRDFITYAELAAQLEGQGWMENVPADKVKDRTKSVRESLRKKNKIGFDGGSIWLIK